MCHLYGVYIHIYVCSSSMAVGPSESGQEGEGEGGAVGSHQSAARKEPLSLDELIAKKAEAEARESKVIPACGVHDKAN